MKAITIIILFLAITTAYSFPVDAGIRCKNDIISIGDTSSEVMIKLRRCGELLYKEVVQKDITVNKSKKKKGEKIIEEKLTEIWHVRVKQRGHWYCYPLYMEEGRLRSIGRWSRCD